MTLIDDILNWFPDRGEEPFGKDYLTLKGEKIISLCPLPILVCDKKFSIRAANPAFARFFKLPLNKLNGRTLFQILGNNKISLTAEGKAYQQITSLSSVVERRNPKIFQGEFPKIGKRVFHVFTRRLAPHVLLLFQDMTEAKALEDQISKSRSELLSVFDGIDDPLVMIDKNFRIRRINEAMLKALEGESYKKFIGKACYLKLHGRSSICPGCTAGKTFVSRKKTTRLGLLEKKPRPDETTYQITCYPLKDASGRVTAIAEGYRDMTETIHLEEELYQSERNRLVESLAAGVAHEVRNPLAIIQSTAQYCLGQVDENRELKESFETIIRSSQVANRVVGSLLDFSRPSEVAFKRQPIKPLLDGALRLIRGRAKSQKVRIVRFIAKNMPPLLIDDKRLSQALVNFFVNSLDAMANGGTLTLVGQRNHGKRGCVISIKDTGGGIPEEVVSRIFQPFYSTKKGGIGLGLPIAEAIIRSHDGRVSFKSLKGKGSEVVIELPLTKKRAMISFPRANARSAPGLSSHRGPTLPCRAPPIRRGS